MAGIPARHAPDIRGLKNASGTSIAANTVIKLDSTEDQIVLPAATTDHLYGAVMDAAIPNGEFGDVQVHGVALCRAAGALATPGILVMSDTAGRVQAWAAGGGTNAQVLGTLRSTAGALDDLVEVELAGPGVIKQG